VPKTVPPGIISIPDVGEFVANAVPDPFDERDLEYRPRLAPLPASLDQRTLKGRYVLRQGGQSCTGHALASVINTVLASRTPRASEPPRVSPYMLYRLARRYDEFAGEEDLGSSLRGGLKGWFHHGVALESDWPELEIETEPDLGSEAFASRCRERPLGAFYRVNPYRLDDMQSAISELHAIAVSAAIHDGWIKPVRWKRARETLTMIEWPVNRRRLGGHAFALVGYNHYGFLVQNSWGEEWGKGGYATLSYEDWLDSAYDAWVVRPGVPRTPFATGRSRTTIATGGVLATGPAPDLTRLARHVVNLDNDGRLSTTGNFVSTPPQIDRIMDHMRLWHDQWAAQGLRRHVVIYAHGGLVSEADGLRTADKHLNFWLNNHVYPLYFAWQSGPAETLVDQLVDLLKGKLPIGGLGFDLVEQFDRLTEKFARTSITWMWDQMKQNARAASEAIQGPHTWPPGPRADLPGATLTLERLRQYLDQQGSDAVSVHLVGHSAGSIFVAPLLGRLADAQIKVDSLALLAPAIRVDEFARNVLPHLGTTVEAFATFAMSDARELDDALQQQGITVYHKSLLYLVSRALERTAAGDQGGEVRLLGMERFFDRPVEAGSPRTLRQAIEASGGVCVFSRSAAPDDCRSDSTSHGGFDDDAQSMTSIVMRILKVSEAEQVEEYSPNAPLRPVPGIPESGPPAPATAQPLLIAAAAQPPGSAAPVRTGEPQTRRPVAPIPRGRRVPVEVGEAPRSGSPIGDQLIADGWNEGSGAARRRATKKAPAPARVTRSRRA
jgi:Papain family cysteine protease